MSVIKSKREESVVEFVNTARELNTLQTLMPTMRYAI